MALILSPWPAATASVAAANALACLKSALGTSALTDERLVALGSTAAAMVAAFAPGAPQPVKNEAVIRLSGWLKGSPAPDLTPIGVSGIDLAWRPGASRNAMRSSGAGGLLSAWRKPRAMAL